MFLCKQRDQDLTTTTTTTTTTKQNSSEARKACFDSRSDGAANQAHNTQRCARMAAAHKQVGEPNHQEAQSGISSTGRARTTTVTALQQGGASHRGGREKPVPGTRARRWPSSFFSTPALDRRLIYSPTARSWRSLQGNHEESPAAMLSAKTAAATAPPFKSDSDREGPEDFA